MKHYFLMKYYARELIEPIGGFTNFTPCNRAYARCRDAIDDGAYTGGTHKPLEIWAVDDETLEIEIEVLDS